MNCWICSRQWKFCYCLVQFISSQNQWPGLRYRTFNNNVIRMAADLSATITRPDVIIADQRDGWDFNAGIELCRALKRRRCDATIIYVDLAMAKGVVVKYLVDVHDDDEFVDIIVDTVEMAKERWEYRLLDAVEEALEIPLQLSRQRPTEPQSTSPFSDN